MRCPRRGSACPRRAARFAAIDKIIASLDDDDPEVRFQALVALTQIDAQPSDDLFKKIENLLADGSINVRIQAVITLAKMGRGKEALPELTKWIQPGDPALRIAALETFGRVAAYSGGQLDASPVLSALHDPSSRVRAAACLALKGIKDEAVTHALVSCLSDPDASVRKAAAASLRDGGLHDPALILNVLDSKDGSARDAALDALSHGDARTSDRMRTYAEQEIKNLRLHFAEVASLPPADRAGALLHEILQRQVERHESRLVKIVGLIGDPRVMDLVSKSLHGTDPEVRAAALEALETLGDKSLSHGILTLLDEEPARMSPSIILERFLDGGDRWLCALSVRAVQELDLKEFIPKLDGLKTHPDALIRESAMEALVRFGEVKPMDTLQTVSTLERVLLLREVPIFADLTLKIYSELQDAFKGGDGLRVSMGFTSPNRTNASIADSLMSVSGSFFNPSSFGINSFKSNSWTARTDRALNHRSPPSINFSRIIEGDILSGSSSKRVRMPPRQRFISQRFQCFERSSRTSGSVPCRLLLTSSMTRGSPIRPTTLTKRRSCRSIVAVTFHV